MASIGNDPGGRRRILFTDDDGKRKTIRLGKMSKDEAEFYKRRIEHLISARQRGEAPDGETSRWVGRLRNTLHKRLAAVGLVVPREQREATKLGAFLDAYFANRSDVKPSTMTHWRHTERCLISFFGADRAIDSITPGDAKDFERWLGTKAARENKHGENPADSGLAPNTIRKRISNAKQFFADAVSRELLNRNPFHGLKSNTGGNRKRDAFVTREDAAKILDACPDAEWRLIFALSRYGGLRCPSEHLKLRWSDVDFAGGRFTVHSPKTEHHEGGDFRVVPLFHELRPYFDDAFYLAPKGTEFVIGRYRDVNANLRTQLTKIIKRAGLQPWPKLFQNLRASRATELAQEYPAHVAAAWLGHSTLVAQKHYWQVTDADYQRAAGEPDSKAAQNPAHYPGLPAPLTATPDEPTINEPREKGVLGQPLALVDMCPVGDDGLEPPTSTV